MKKIIAIVGPTATGKSELAVKLAKKYNGEIISADSRQVYKGLNIGTGKMTKREKQSITHYLLDVISPKKLFTADDFLKLGSKAIDKIYANNHIPIIAGGTGFYVDALLERVLLPSVPPNPKLRKKLETKSIKDLFTMLKKVDSARSRTIQKTNKRRLIRAIEIALSIPNLKPKIQYLKPDFKVLWLGLNLPNPELKKKIRERFLLWLKQGLIKEAKWLSSKVSKKRLREIGLMYPILAEYLNGSIAKKEMIERSVNSIYHYAKRQKTWFKRNKKIHWVKDKEEAINLSKNFIKK